MSTIQRISRPTVVRRNGNGTEWKLSHPRNATQWLQRNGNIIVNQLSEAHAITYVLSDGGLAIFPVAR